MCIRDSNKYRDQIKQEAEEVKKAGGLYILGTERHESRRIDNQLRGRAGRQGDPGESRFFLSAEDDLMRLFGGEKIQHIMDALNLDEDEPIENKMLSNTIESAQRKVEGRNFGIRKNVLQYDDVMNRQREIIYGQRSQVLNGEDIHDNILQMIRENIQENVTAYLPENEVHDNWNVDGLRDHYLGYITTPDDLRYSVNELADLQQEDVIRTLTDRALKLYEDREKMFGPDMLRELERVILLKTVDSKWIDHIDAMDELRRGIDVYKRQDILFPFNPVPFRHTIFRFFIDEWRKLLSS